MAQVERRHDRLAVRLSLIISRLVAGETLDLQALATEFGVSVRTLRRDFRERLMYLDLEYRKGRCRLLSGTVPLPASQRAGIREEKHSENPPEP